MSLKSLSFISLWKFIESLKRVAHGMWSNQSFALRLFENGVEKNFERKNQYGFDNSSELHNC